MSIDIERLRRAQYVIISDRERLRLNDISGVKSPTEYPAMNKSLPIFYDGLPVGSVSKDNRNVITNIAFALEHLEHIEYYYGDVDPNREYKGP